MMGFSPVIETDTNIHVSMRFKQFRWTRKYEDVDKRRFENFIQILRSKVNERVVVNGALGEARA